MLEESSIFRVEGDEDDGSLGCAERHQAREVRASALIAPVGYQYRLR
jgi:hypothetical protein